MGDLRLVKYKGSLRNETELQLLFARGGGGGGGGDSDIKRGGMLVGNFKLNP